MTDQLRVRAYNVRFGDAILITIPDRDAAGVTTTRNILIDVGNVLSDKHGGHLDDLFAPVVESVTSELDGRPLDLYVMTHEHLDHVQGLLHVSETRQKDLEVNHAWLTASADPGYYTSGAHPRAEKEFALARSSYLAIRRYLDGHAADSTPYLDALLLNNEAFMLASSTTRKCVEYLRTLAGAENTTYIHADSDLAGRHPFNEAKLTVLAPEENTADYYGRFQPMALGELIDEADAATSLVLPKPPSGVDAGAFYNLVESRRRTFSDNLLNIDRAANNTSVVLQIEWRGWRLLFPGDAETRSWRQMNKNSEQEGAAERGQELRPVHLLKVGHHGSHNGTPPVEILERVLPLQPPADGRKRVALISTFDQTYNNVPDTDTLTEIKRRVTELVDTRTVGDGKFTDVFFPG